MSILRIGLIGYGYWGPNQVRAFSAVDGCVVTQVADASKERLASLNLEHPEIETTTDADELLSADDVDAVVVATPTTTHHAIVRQALLSGKHVLCEKPLCCYEAEADELVEIADSQQLILMVGNVFLFNAGIQKLKDLVVDGELGTIHYVSSIRTNLGPIRSDVNATYDLAAHDVAIFNWLFDAEPEVVSATGGAFVQKSVDDVVFITLIYPGGQIANIHASWLNPKKVRQITLVGNRRMVTWDDLDLSTPVAIFDRGVNINPEPHDYGEFLRISMWDGDVRLPKIDMTEPLRAQCSHFLRAVATGTIDRSDGRFSRGVVRVLQAANESIQNKGVPVHLAAGESPRPLQ